MRNPFTTAILVCALLTPGLDAPASAAEPPTAMNQPSLQVRQGDVIVQQDDRGNWITVKILQVDPAPDGSQTAHCLTYAATPARPTVETLPSLSVRIWHAPILASSFDKGWERIANQAVAKDELVGFVEYLKLTDFPRYVSFTGQDSGEIVRKANEHYKRAYALGDEGRRTEAIAEYSRAIDLFPLFYEAIDNRGFTYMELGRYEDALADFESSLRVEPDGVAAFFSRGECLLRLERLPEAIDVFSEGLERFPEKRAMFQEHLDLARSMKQSH